MMVRLNQQTAGSFFSPASATAADKTILSF
jgi:hypothetical protein